MRYHSTIAKLAVLGAITLFSAGAFAMGPTEKVDNPDHECGCMQKHEGHEGIVGHQKRLPWVLKKKLGLTGKQAGEISDIIKEEHQNAKPLFETVHKERKALMDVAKSGDEAAIKAQAGKLADAIAAMAVRHAQVHKRIAAVMTKEQAEKFEKMGAEFGKCDGKKDKKPYGGEHEKGRVHKHQDADK
jgi:Spy/CpxP family protein refolding chaperone